MATNPLGGLMFTLATVVLPLTEYSVEAFAPWSDTQNGPVALSATPQGLINAGSVIVAIPATLETRSVWR